MSIAVAQPAQLDPKQLAELIRGSNGTIEANKRISDAFKYAEEDNWKEKLAQLNPLARKLGIVCVGAYRPEDESEEQQLRADYAFLLKETLGWL